MRVLRYVFCSWFCFFLVFFRSKAPGHDAVGNNRICAAAPCVPYVSKRTFLSAGGQLWTKYPTHKQWDGSLLAVPYHYFFVVQHSRGYVWTRRLVDLEDDPFSRETKQLRCTQGQRGTCDTSSDIVGQSQAGGFWDKRV